VETKKKQRKSRYFVAVVGFLLVAIELMLVFNEVALYQSLICSVYLLFNILIDLSAWIDRYWVQKCGRKINYVEAKFIGGVILMPFWLLFNWLLGLIAPRISQEIIWLWSFAIVIVLIIISSVPDYIVRERSFSKKKRSAVRSAIGVLVTLVVPYVAIVVILSAYGVLSSGSKTLAVLAFLPIMFFAMMLSSMIASRSQLKDALAAGAFFAGVAAIPFAVAVFMVLSVSYQIPYICALVVAYVSLIYWLRSIRAKNRLERESRTPYSMNQ
jgi:hypothetical protein